MPLANEPLNCCEKFFFFLVGCDCAPGGGVIPFAVYFKSNLNIRLEVHGVVSVVHGFQPTGLCRLMLHYGIRFMGGEKYLC